MSYYGRQWYPRQRCNRHFRSYSRTSCSSSSSYGRSLTFVRSEFFQLDPLIFERFTDFYARKYGDGPKRYLQRTYPHWRSGTTNMASQTERRILVCVPPFLDKVKQFELLSFQIPAVIHQQNSELKVRSIRMAELEATYRNLAKSVLEREYKLGWFVNEVFPSEELTEFLNIFKYTTIDCLRQSFTQVSEDLLLMHDFLPKIDGSVDMSYHIALLDCTLDVDVYPPHGTTRLDISMPEPRLVTQFRDQYKTILLDHALNQCKVAVTGHVNRQIALTDVQTVVTQLERTKSDQEYDSTIEVQGHGGTLRLCLQKKDLLRLRYATAKQIVKLLIAICISGVVVVWLCVKGFWPILFCLGFICLGIIGSIWGKLNELKTEVKEYERRRATRLKTL